MNVKRTLTLQDMLSLRTLPPQHHLAMAPDGRHAAFVLRNAGDPPRVWRLAVISLRTGDIQILNEPPPLALGTVLEPFR